MTNWPLKVGLLLIIAAGIVSLILTRPRSGVWYVSCDHQTCAFECGGARCEEAIAMAELKKCSRARIVQGLNTPDFVPYELRGKTFSPLP